MVVDDSEINKKLFCRLLSLEGFTNCETAAHGLEAVEKLILFRDQGLLQWKRAQEEMASPTLAKATEDPHFAVVMAEKADSGDQQGPTFVLIRKCRTCSVAVVPLRHSLGCLKTMLSACSSRCHAQERIVRRILQRMLSRQPHMRGTERSGARL